MTNFNGDGLRRMSFRLALLLLIATLNSAQSATPPSWTAYNHAYSGFDYNTSVDAQDGFSLAKIENTNLEFSEELLDQIHYSYFSLDPKGYLIQKFEARQYRNKHLHISAFARAIQPELSTLESWFDEQFTLWLESELNTTTNNTRKFGNRSQYASEDYRAELKEQFSKALTISNDNANYGIWVLLHLPTETIGRERIQVHTATSFGEISNPQLWHRFNVEVSIPENCNAISIVYWAHGVINTEVDHFAITEQGKALTNNPAWRQLSTGDALGKGLNKIDIQANANYQNLSFEAR